MKGKERDKGPVLPIVSAATYLEIEGQDHLLLTNNSTISLIKLPYWAFSMSSIGKVHRAEFYSTPRLKYALVACYLF